MHKPVLAVIHGGGCRQIENATGILQALDEAGIEFDEYQGASAGAIVAALHASGLNGKALEHLVKDTPIAELFKFSLWQGIKLLIPFVKVNHVYDNSGLFKMLADHMTSTATSKVQVSVTRLPDSVSEMLVATPETVLASSAIPEVFEPVKIGEKSFVDGGVINNIPTPKIIDIDKYEHIYIILCNQDAKDKKTSWTKVGRSLAAINQTMDREVHQIQTGWQGLPNVTIIQPPPFRSHLLEWSDNFGLIKHAYEFTKSLFNK